MLHKHSYEVFLLFTVICNGVRSSDVIQNISYANKALQEFLKNYDQIQKILKSEDGLQSNSTSSENEESSNILLHDKRNVKKKNLLFKQIENTSARTLQLATAGIYESDSLDDDGIHSKELTNQAKNKEKSPKTHTNKVKIQDNVNANIDLVKDDTDSDKDSSEYDESEDVAEIPLEMPEKTDVIKLKHKKNVINNDKKVISKKPKIFKNLLGEKTRFSIQHFRSNKSKSDNLLKNFKEPLKIEENSRRIKKIIYSESFSPKNIWQEIISRPIKLRKDKDSFMRSDTSNRNNDKITIVILTKNEMEDNNSFKRTTDLAVDSEKVKLEYLRKTYGDTCLQVPIKKCNKVIKAVNKRVCKERFKCKSELKSSFIENGKKACKKQYVYIKAKNNSKTQEKEHKIQPLEFRQHKGNDNFVDATRNRFFNKRYLRKNSDNLNTISLHDDTLGSNIQPMPLPLRDRYERECQEENRKRCINACEYATEKTCSKHSCGNNKSKAFKKSCKEECHRLFYIDKYSDSDSSDSDSDSDSTDSDSDSD